MELTPQKDFWSALCKKLKITKLGYEAHEVSVAGLSNLKKAFGKEVSFQKTRSLIENIREQKTKEEIQKLQKAAQISDKALTVTVQYIKKGITEKELAWIYESEARAHLGAEALSFETIVAFGANSAIPHHETSNEKLKMNTPLLIDCGVISERYCSDMTRCFFFGKPTKKWIQTYNLVLKAQEAGIQKIQMGEKCSAPEEAAREIFGKEEKFFGHSFGHGVGLEIHESPTLSVKSKSTFTENMVVTAEPGIYYPGEFGIRIEDIGIVQKSGYEVISGFSKSQNILE